MEIELKPLMDDDIGIFKKWLDKEYIYKRLCPNGDEEKNDWVNEVNNRNSKYSYMKHFIVTCNDKKIGFCHYMDCDFEQEYTQEHYGITVDKGCVYEIGYFIGEEEYLNKGIGKIIVRKLEERIIETGGKEILADPDEKNIISIRTLLSNGFAKIKDSDYRKKLNITMGQLDINIRFAKNDDYSWLKEHDEHISNNVLKIKLENKEIYVVEKSDKITGWLRYNLFWDNIPFMNMIFLSEKYRNMGIGTKLVKRWEDDMKQMGYKNVLTSTQSDEEAQRFYRKLGYKEIGGFKYVDDPYEIIFQKTL
jgi:GNAT superfamily N-acetyltransferase